VQRLGDKPGQLDAGTGAGLASSGPCVTPGQLCQYRVGGEGLCVVLTVLSEKDFFLNFNDFIVATIQQHWLPR